MKLDWEALRLAFEVVQAVITIVLWLYVRGVNRHRATTEHIEQLATAMDARMDGHENRITRVEEKLRHAPGHEDLAAVHGRINELSGAIRELTGVMNGVQRSLSRVEDVLIHNEVTK